MGRKVLSCVALLVLVLLAVGVRADDDQSKKDITLSIGGVKPGESRSTVERAIGAPIFVETDTHSVHYGNGVIVEYSGSTVVNVHGPQLEIDGQASWITTRKALDKALLKDDDDDNPAPTSSPDPSDTQVSYPKYGLTAYLNDGAITGFLLEPGRGRSEAPRRR